MSEDVVQERIERARELLQMVRHAAMTTVNQGRDFIRDGHYEITG